MAHTSERRLVGRPSGILSLGGDRPEYTQILPQYQTLQAAHIASRFVVSDALARAVAELAFARRPQR